MHDTRVPLRVLQRVGERLAPHRVYADREAVVAERLRDAPELAAADGDNHVGAEQLGRLRRDAPDGARPTEHEYSVARDDLRLPRNRYPGGDAGDSERSGDDRIRSLRKRELKALRHRHALGEEPVPGRPASFAEDVHERSVLCPARSLAARHVRQRRVPAVEDAVADRDVERVERYRLDPHAVDVSELGDLRWLLQRVDTDAAHARSRDLVLEA